MWLRTQDKTKLINLHNIEFITISKSYGGKDKNGNVLNSAIVIQQNAITLGLYKCETDSLKILDELEKAISIGETRVFDMP